MCGEFKHLSLQLVKKGLRVDCTLASKNHVNMMLQQCSNPNRMERATRLSKARQDQPEVRWPHQFRHSVQKAHLQRMWVAESGLI
jgi:hypothetical protein